MTFISFCFQLFSFLFLGFFWFYYFASSKTEWRIFFHNLLNFLYSYLNIPKNCFFFFIKRLLVFIFFYLYNFLRINKLIFYFKNLVNLLFRIFISAARVAINFLSNFVVIDNIMCVGVCMCFLVYSLITFSAVFLKVQKS